MFKQIINPVNIIININNIYLNKLQKVVILINQNIRKNQFS